MYEKRNTKEIKTNLKAVRKRKNVEPDITTPSSFPQDSPVQQSIKKDTYSTGKTATGCSLYKVIYLA